MQIKNQKAFGYFIAAISVFFWGITFVCTKYLLQDFTSLEILFFRFIGAYLGLWLIYPKHEKIATRDNFLYAIAGLTSVVLYQLTENIAIHFTNASNVSVIVSICPLFTAILSQIFLKEKHLSVWFITGFVVSITGVTLVCLNGNKTLEFNPKGDVLALVSGICWGFYSILISVLNKKNYNNVASSRRIFFFSVLMMIPLSLFGWRLGTNAAGFAGGADSEFLQSLYFSFDKTVNAARFSNPLNWLYLLFLGVVANGFCFAMWNKACKICGTVRINCALYLIPVVTIIFAFFTLGEKITLLGAAGALITIAGLFVSERK